MTDQLFDGSGEALLTRRTKLLQSLLVLWLISIFAMSVVDVSQIVGLFVLEEIESSRLVLTIACLGIVIVVANIAAMVVFAMWIYRAAANIHNAEVSGFDYTPGWSVGWYFLPFANLVKPFQAMRQIWNASRGASGNLDNGNSTLTIWWTFWLLSNFANNISLRMSLKDDPEMIKLGLMVGLAGSVASIPLFFSARQLIADIADGQARSLHRRVKDY